MHKGNPYPVRKMFLIGSVLHTLSFLRNGAINLYDLLRNVLGSSVYNNQKCAVPNIHQDQNEEIYCNIKNETQYQKQSWVNL